MTRHSATASVVSRGAGNQGRAEHSVIAAGRQAQATGSVAGQKRLPWYRWYTGDWLSRTRDWSLAARGAYRELLDAQWDLGDLPEDSGKLRALIRATPAEWRQAWPVIGGEFPVKNGRRSNPVLEAERVASRQLLERRQAASQKALQKRWGRRKVVPLERGGHDA